MCINCYKYNKFLYLMSIIFKNFSKINNINVSSTAKIKVLVKLFQKLAVSKGRAFGRRSQTAKLQGVRGRSPCLLICSEKFFVKLFPKKV